MTTTRQRGKTAAFLAVATVLAATVLAATSVVAGGEVTAGDPPASADPVVRTRYLVFVDDFFALPTHRNRVLAAIRRQLDVLSPGDEMAVVSFDGRELALLGGWTSSRPEMEKALDEAAERSAFGLRRISELRRLSAAGEDDRRPRRGSVSFQSSFSSIGFEGSGQGAGGGEIAALITDQISRVVEAAASALGGVARPPDGAGPERRVMLLLAGGWPAWSESGDAFRGTRHLAPEERFRVFEPLVAKAKLLGYALYGVDLRPDGWAAGQRGLVFDSRDSLVRLAEATGGQALEGKAALTALERAANEHPR